jgi:gamma-glutamyltranspeptidase/glutathione hydrolase
VTRIAVATTSQLAAEAASELASKGGNAVDCALAAVILAMNTQPAVCALAGGAFVTIWTPDRSPVTIDGNVAIPGIGVADSDRGKGAVPVTLDYGGGITTFVGPGSVAVPGSLAALELAWQRFGRARWRDLFVPTLRAAGEGFPLPKACRYYLDYSDDRIFSRSDDGYSALHTDDGSIRDAGDRIVVPHLAATLAAIAEEGSRVFYKGDIAQSIVDHVRAGDGALTRQDLLSYRAIERQSLLIDAGCWRIATNPPPAIGGAVLAAMLLACAEPPIEEWNRESLARLIQVQRAVLSFRMQHLDLAADVDKAISSLLENARDGSLLAHWTSASTVHTSVVDADGVACAVTASSGYGSGEMAPGTGLWLNNCLGEIELNRRGLDAGPVGARLPSNMAPSIARREGTVLAIGTPGADRITTALHQVLVNLLTMDMPLAEAITHPRLHVDTTGDLERLAAEPGLDLPGVDLPVRTFPDRNMYFGGVAAALFDSESGFEIAADPRREGGVATYDG